MVRNSVLLIDFANLALADGRSLGEAVVEAAAVRLRPILLTRRHGGGGRLCHSLRSDLPGPRPSL